MDIITATDLASYLRDPGLEESVAQVVDLTNALVSEEWSSPVAPVPTKIKLLALNVAARAWVYDPSKAHLESYSRQIDDAAKTERYRAAGDRGSVYLTPDETARLQGAPVVGSVRLIKAGDRP